MHPEQAFLRLAEILSQVSAVSQDFMWEIQQGQPVGDEIRILLYSIREDAMVDAHQHGQMY